MPDKAPKPVYLLKGTDPLRREQALQDLVSRLVEPSFRDFDYSVLDGREASSEQILAAAAAIPFGSPRRVTVVNDAQCLAPDVMDRLKTLLPVKTGDHATLVFVLTEAKPRRARGARSGPDDDDEAGGASTVGRRLATLAKSLGSVETYDRLQPDEARAWLVDRLARTGKRLQPTAAAALVDRTGMDLNMLSREADKLALFAGDRGEVTRDDVLAVVPETAEFTIWALTDAAVSGRPADALRALARLRSQGQPAQLILPMLARQLRVIWKAKMLLELPDGADRAPAKPEMQDWQVRKSSTIARRYTWERLQAALQATLARDLALKGIEGPPCDEDEALQTLVVELSAGPSPRG